MKPAGCTCFTCNPRKPREQWGVNAHGQWRQPSTYFPLYAEARWEIRENKRRERQARLEELLLWQP